MNDCSIYKLPRIPHCGVAKLPFPANAVGSYYFKIKVGENYLIIPSNDITTSEQYFYLNAGKLPINRELLVEIYTRSTNVLQKFNLTRNIGSECYPENVSKCFSQFILLLEPSFGIINYDLQFPDAQVETPTYYQINFVNGNYVDVNHLIPDVSLYTVTSVNDSIRVWVAGEKYYWNEGTQNFSDQIVIVTGTNRIYFKNYLEGERVEVEILNKFVLK